MQSKNPRSYTGDEKIDQLVTALIEGAEITENADIYRELAVNVIKLGRDKPRLGDLKLIARAFRELRVSNRVFSQYRNVRKVSIFGSARTPETRPEYQGARNSRAVWSSWVTWLSLAAAKASWVLRRKGPVAKKASA